MNNIEQIRTLLLQWAEATREDRRDEVLANHRPDVLIYDVLPPMKYEGAEAYRASWDEWQPDTSGQGRFELEDLVITATDDLAFAHGLIRCGGAMPNGNSFEGRRTRHLLPGEIHRLLEDRPPAHLKAAPTKTRHSVKGPNKPCVNGTATQTQYT